MPRRSARPPRARRCSRRATSGSRRSAPTIPTGPAGAPSSRIYWNDAPGAYSAGDPRAQLLAKLGFRTPEALDRLARTGDFIIGLSAEDLSPIDADVVIWFDEGHKIDGLKLRPTMRAYKEGREIIAGENDLLAGAFSHASLLSIPYALDQLVPLLELAIDGDPATIVPDRREANGD